MVGLANSPAAVPIMRRRVSAPLTCPPYGATLERHAFSFESACRSKLCLEHDLFRKPASTFRDHLLETTLDPADERPLGAGRICRSAQVCRTAGPTRITLVHFDSRPSTTFPAALV